MQAEATIKAKEAKVRAAKKHQDAKTNAAVLDEAFAAAARRGSEEDCIMKGPDLKAAVDAVCLFTQQPGTRSTHGDKPEAAGLPRVARNAVDRPAPGRARHFRCCHRFGRRCSRYG